MSETVDWTPNDYSVTYRIKVDDDLEFVELVDMFSIPPDYPDAKSLPIDDLSRQMARESWDESWLKRTRQKNLKEKREREARQKEQSDRYHAFYERVFGKEKANHKGIRKSYE